MRNALEMFREQYKDFDDFVDSENCEFEIFPTDELVDSRAEVSKLNNSDIIYNENRIGSKTLPRGGIVCHCVNSILYSIIGRYARYGRYT